MTTIAMIISTTVTVAVLTAFAVALIKEVSDKSV